MNNLHRELAPISAAAWTDLEEEARRTFTRHLAGRRLVDVPEPGGAVLAAVNTGHQAPIDPPAEGVVAHLRQAQALVELRVPFTVDRSAVDSVERGAKDPEWQPVKDAARQIAYAEDRLVFEGYPAAGIGGMRTPGSGSPPSETIRMIVLPGGQGLARLTASRMPAFRFVGPALNAWASGRSVKMFRTTSRSVVSCTTGLAEL